MRWTSFLVSTLVLVLANSPAVVLGQDSQDRQDRASGRQNPRSQMNSRFLQADPKVGESIPDVTLYSADGQEFNFASLKGSYSVLVFGCLT